MLSETGSKFKLITVANAATNAIFGGPNRSSSYILFSNV